MNLNLYVASAESVFHQVVNTIEVHVSTILLVREEQDIKLNDYKKNLTSACLA